MTPTKEKPPAGTEAGEGKVEKIDSRIIASADTRVQGLLYRLDRVRPARPGEWWASCPTAAHPRGDRSRGLHVTLANDGRLLIHCMAGCGAVDVLDALGLAMADLFPPRLPSLDSTGHRPRVSAVPWREIFAALQSDLTAASLAFADLANGKAFSTEDAAFIAAKADDLAYQLRRARGDGR